MVSVNPLKFTVKSCLNAFSSPALTTPSWLMSKAAL